MGQLVRLSALSKAAEAQAKPIRNKVTQMALERYTEEGSDRWARDDGLVSLVKPSEYVQVTAPGQLCAWLEGAGHADLVRDVPKILDPHAFADALHHAAWVIDEGGTPEAPVDLARTATSAIKALLQTVDVAAEPVTDWHEHIEWTATDDGTLVLVDGEPIPGCQIVRPPIRSVVVRPDKALVEAEQQRLAGAS